MSVHPDYGTFPDGRPVTEADVERWADEAEKGYDIDQMIAGGVTIHRGPGRPPVEHPRTRRLQVRVDEDTYQRIQRRVSQLGETRSEYLARLVRDDLERSA